MKYQIAIPSYKRAETVVNKTLAYLKKTNVTRNCITVFVADRQEFRDYRKAGVLCNMVVGKPTLQAQRNFMRKWYDEYDKVFFMDDDIEGIYHADTIKNKDLKLVTDLDGFIRNGFGLCDKFKATLWGISAVLNAYFMYNKGVSFDLKYIIGAVYGEIINHDKYLDVTLEDKEDFERTIKHFIYTGKVIRFNQYAPKTNYYKEKGGMQETRTKERVKDSALALVDRYPKYCQVNTSKKDKEFFEIKLIKQ